MNSIKRTFDLTNSGILFLTLALLMPDFAMAICEDPDGDGYGWNGDKACRTRRVRRTQQPENLTILNHSISDATKNTVRVSANFSDKAAGKIEFGKTENFGSFGPYAGFSRTKEFSQQLTGLEPNTIYYYRVIASSGRSRVVSATGQFQTLAEDTTTTTSTTTTSTTIPSSTTSTTSTSSTTTTTVPSTTTTSSTTTTTSSTTTTIPTTGYKVPAKSPLKVFPGAEGFGTDTTAGRGGVICKVTNLDDSGTGSLRHCAETLSGPRIVVFDVGGLIYLNSTINITNPNISIYGQTAPGDGIAVSVGPLVDGNVLNVRTDDVLIQHMRFRPDDSTLFGGSLDTGTSCCRNAFGLFGGSNVVIDHNSFSWGTDQIVNSWFEASNNTWSYNLFSDGLFDAGVNSKGPAGRGILLGTGPNAGNMSFHHNLNINSYQRNPKIKVGRVMDMVNNLTYNWGTREGQHSGEFGGTANWVKNHWIAGPGTTSPGWGGIQLEDTFSNMVYFEDNFGIRRSSHSEPQTQIAITFYNEILDPSLGYHTNTRFPAPPITEIPVDDLLTELPPQAGATLPKRDQVDRNAIRDLETGGGQIIDCVRPDSRGGANGCAKNAGGFPTYAISSAPADSDNDGIPDSWEVVNGLDPNINDSLIDSNNDGYLNIEDYVHSIQESGGSTEPKPEITPLFDSSANSLRVLFVGNSYMASRPPVNGEPSNFTVANQIRDLMGVTIPNVFARTRSIGGGTLEEHWNAGTGTDSRGNTTARNEIENGNYDLIIFQGRYDIHQSKANEDRFADYADLFANLANQNNSNVVFYGLWATDSQISSSNGDTFGPVAHEIYRSAAVRNNTSYAPNGMAYGELYKLASQSMSDSAIEDKYTADSVHPNIPLAYMAANVVYATIFGEQPPGLGEYRPASLNDNDGNLMRQVAWDAAKDFSYSVGP